MGALASFAAAQYAIVPSTAAIDWSGFYGITVAVPENAT